MAEAGSRVRDLRVVALGGGTGLPVVLRGFKELGLVDVPEDKDRLVAIVTVCDDGGSSGRLRDEFDMIPPGDIRNCMVALSHNEPLMSRLFQARYRSGGALDGHTAGNLILAALAQDNGGNFLAAVSMAGEVLNIHGTVLPCSLASTRLVARLADGTTVRGESNIRRSKQAVSRVWLDPESPSAAPGVAEAIERADIVVMGPGSLFTSIAPNLLVPEIRDALSRTGAFRILLVNAMTEAGETDAFDAAAHVRAVSEHLGFEGLDAVLLAADEIPDDTLERYRSENACPVDAQTSGLDALVPMVFRRNILELTPKVRHEPRRTALAVVAAHKEWTRRSCPRPRPGAVMREGGRA